MASANAKVLSLKTAFPFRYTVDNRGGPMIIGVSAHNPNLVIPQYPISAYYVRPESDETYCLNKLFDIYNTMTPVYPSNDRLIEIIKEISPIDDLTHDEIFMILEWYDQMNRQSDYNKPFILMMRNAKDSENFKSIYNVNGLIDYVQNEGGVTSLYVDPHRTFALPLWINTPFYVPNNYTHPAAYLYIIDFDVFGKWMQKYII